MTNNERNAETLSSDLGMSARQVMERWEERYGWYEALYLERDNELEMALYTIRRSYRKGA